MRTLRACYAVAAIALLAAKVPAADLTGSWKGRLTATDGSTSEVQVDFSPQGYPLYTYTNNRGVTRQVELSQIGQTIEYVPQGGGVQRVVVKTMDGGPGRLSVGMVGSFERASNGYMDQRRQAALFEYALAPEGLVMRLTIESTSHFGDKDGIVGGNPDTVVAEGVLKRVQ